MAQRMVVIQLVGGAKLRLTQNTRIDRKLTADAAIVRERMVDLTVPFNEFQGDWFANEQIIFMAEGIPQWPALSPAYAARKARMAPGMPILRLTDRLYDSLTGMTADTVYEAGPRRLRLGTAVPYAQYHTRRRPHVQMLPATWQLLQTRIFNYVFDPFNKRR